MTRGFMKDGGWIRFDVRRCLRGEKQRRRWLREHQHVRRWRSRAMQHAGWSCWRRAGKERARKNILWRLPERASVLRYLRERGKLIKRKRSRGFVRPLVGRVTPSLSQKPSRRRKRNVAHRIRCRKNFVTETGHFESRGIRQSVRYANFRQS